MQVVIKVYKDACTMSDDGRKAETCSKLSTCSASIHNLCSRNPES
jgi:hypothetical protein